MLNEMKTTSDLPIDDGEKRQILKNIIDEKMAVLNKVTTFVFLGLAIGWIPLLFGFFSEWLPWHRTLQIVAMTIHMVWIRSVIEKLKKVI